MRNKKTNLLFPVIAGGVAALFIIVVGTFLVGKKASSDTEKAVRAVSFLYLDELAGRREQVVATALKNTSTKSMWPQALWTVPTLAARSGLGPTRRE